ncbi:hypothetical protein BD779DRAFT_1477622 [Infundibulicybe gibba]|nr:hypothetical protein BD779DRAFT_1477622 [Infundibulicybe gibba]
MSNLRHVICEVLGGTDILTSPHPVTGYHGGWELNLASGAGEIGTTQNVVRILLTVHCKQNDPTQWIKFACLQVGSWKKVTTSCRVGVSESGVIYGQERLIILARQVSYSTQVQPKSTFRIRSIRGGAYHVAAIPPARLEDPGPELGGRRSHPFVVVQYDNSPRSSSLLLVQGSIEALMVDHRLKSHTKVLEALIVQLPSRLLLELLRTSFRVLDIHSKTMSFFM